MYLLLAVLALGAESTDTTVAVRPGTRLELNSFQGRISVAVWEREAVRIRAVHGAGTRISITEGAGTLRVEADRRYGPAAADWTLTVPAAMALALSSLNGDVTVEGARGEMEISSVNGNLTLRGGSGVVSLETVSGNIRISEASGRIRMTAMNGAIAGRGLRGASVAAETVNGRIELEEVEAAEVEAGSVSGSIRFGGALQAEGRYRFSSHSGDITLATPALDATVSVSTFSGRFTSSFPVTTRPEREGEDRGRFTFTAGSGKARVELESFAGTIAIQKGSGREL